MAGIYIHIPYCRKACHYCNFHFSTQLESKPALIAAIRKELLLRAGELNGQEVQTIYFGGGTPSLLTGAELLGLLEVIRAEVNLAAGAEITLEANPDDLSSDLLAVWRKAGINRLSIGVQSFHQADLDWMNRAHSAVEAKRGIEWVREAGFENFSIDLIYGTPGLSDAAWVENIEQALDFGVPHLSCYALTVEEKTALAHMVKTAQMPDTDPEQQSRQFLILMEAMRAAGYEQYEISNFALPGRRSRHNSSYWKGDAYLGVGPGAHSFDGRFRRWNVSNNALYIKALQGDGRFHEQEELTEENRRHEYIMTSLRTVEGLDLDYFGRAFGGDAVEGLLSRVEGYRSLVRAEGTERLLVAGGWVRLTDQGRLFADGIAGYLF